MDILRNNKNQWMLYEKEVPHSRFCDPACGVSPAEKLNPEHLPLLRNAFTCPKGGLQTREKLQSGRNRGGSEERGMRLEEFREVLQSVIGPDVEDAWVERFFNEVDICCTGQMKWQQLCSYLLLEYTERERASIPRAALLDSQPQIRHCSHNKREPTVRVVAVSHPPPLRYISVSKGGQITVWNSSLHILKTVGDLGEHCNMVSYRYISNIHQEPVNRLMFEPNTNVIMSSSESDNTSVVFMSVSLKQEPYIWKFKQGAKCFDYNTSLQLMVTGGCDRMELRVWDISSHHCLKTVSLQFPCMQLGRIPEHSNFPFLLLSPPLPEQTQPHLVVGCKDYLALLSLAVRERGRGGWLADEGRELGPNVPALSCALYNPTLRQVVTGHADSSVSLWDVETGKRWLQISNAHGEEELTCMTLDSSHRRLITGACNGTIKVWSLLNGLNLHKLEPVTNSEVTAVTCLHDNQLLAVGWSQQITQYNIAGAKQTCHGSREVSTNLTSWLWVSVLHWGSLPRPAMMERVALPVDSLLFLQHRAGNRKFRNRGVLVSSQAGCLCFWSITGQTHSYGQFYAPEQQGERVLSLSSDQPKNTILVSGDTTGWLQIWDISHFALDIQHEPVCERPPLLQCWKAHMRALVSVEVLEVADRLFVLAASADGSAGLWTNDGDHVGSFGQEVMWDISDPATYQSSSDTHRETQSNPREETAGRTESDEVGSSKVKNKTPDPTSSGQTSQEECCSEDQRDREKSEGFMCGNKSRKEIAAGNFARSKTEEKKEEKQEQEGERVAGPWKQPKLSVTVANTCSLSAQLSLQSLPREEEEEEEKKKK
ncbi:hypothetical protein PAMP_010508 [Pampus punctatissimus]